MKNILILEMLMLCVTCLLCGTLLIASENEPSDKISSSDTIEVLNVKQLSMVEFAKLLSLGTDWQIVVSHGASDVKISTYLKNVNAESALKAVCQAYNLWFRKIPDSEIFSIITLDEYKRGMRTYANESVKVVTLKYPDAREVGDALQKLFRDRVVWNRPDTKNMKSIDDIEDALERMDALADRAQFSLTTNNASSNNKDDDNDDDDDDDDDSDRDDNSNKNNNKNIVVEDIKREVNAEVLMTQLAKTRKEMTGARIDQPGIVYISVFRGSNDLLMRSSDPQSLNEIYEVLKQLDKPRPQVLLEVKVLDITLDDSDSRGIDWLFKAGDFSGGRSTGLNQTVTQYGEILPPNSNMVPQGTGLDPRAMVLQLVTDNVLARIQLLEDRNRITSLATPTLCVADGEASRVFVGTETTILTGVSVTQNTTGGDIPTTVTAINPQDERRNIGTTLLITPRIHADRTATIRIVQEDSAIGKTTTIVYGQEQSFQSSDIDTRSVVTTVVAADGKISAIGGLIREEISDRDIGVPGLMDAKWIGPLFKTQYKVRERHELLVLIRPFVLLAPGEAEPVSKDLLKRISEHPSARDDIPALKIGESEFMIVNETMHRIPQEAFDAVKKRSQPWTTE